jgi:biotin carboxyl carrier protein
MKAPEAVAALAEILVREGLWELSIETGDQGIRLRRRSAPPAAVEEAAEESVEESIEESQAVVLRSQVVGIVHLSDHLGGDPLVRADQRVEQGRILGFVESMSINHELVAPVSGRLVEILVHEGDPVEYGQALMILFPDAGG